jgi:DNA-binding response OmpR family regulator
MMSESINILIIGDDVKLLDVIRAQFESSKMVDFNCTILDEPSLGLSKVIDLMPDFIVLDIFMDNSKGRDVCDQLFRNTNTNSIPIMFLTTADSVDEIDKVFLFGSIAYHKKNDNLNDLIRSIIVHDALTPINKSLDKLMVVTREVETNYEN